ncbi:MAG: nitronate monooxygenase [Polyangiales bacterium]
MKTRITELLGIEHPILCPGMTHVSNAELVAAVGNAGGLGILAVGHLSPEDTRAEIRKVRDLSKAPFGVGAALIMPGAKANAEIAIEEKVPVINFSLGKGDWICERVHAYGGKVLATVVNRKHALAAERAGVDGLLVTGHEAAAHGGDVTSLVLVPALRSVTKLPIVAAGGFATGGSLVAALALGADAVAMGTRFLATRESPVHEATKSAVIAKTESETLYTSNFDGMPCRIMKTEAAEEVARKPLSTFTASMRAMTAAREMGTPLGRIVSDVAKQGPAQTLALAHFGAATLAIKRAIKDGDLESGVQLIGQAQGLVVDAPSVAEVVKRVLAEAAEARRRVDELV